MLADMPHVPYQEQISAKQRQKHLVHKMRNGDDTKKISMASGTESVIWHMMNDMHRAMATEAKDVEDVESLRDVDREQLRKRKTVECRIRIAVGIALILLVLFVTIFVSEMKKRHP
ncbi:hypothetical protein BJV82DRAFT_656539 [Fennellomyces sp. T-0311]|nr:hypothetical protein BJV82DRAFT_656539 [Fennellomyces sp. T-0311]